MENQPKRETYPQSAMCQGSSNNIPDSMKAVYAGPMPGPMMELGYAGPEAYKNGFVNPFGSGMQPATPSTPQKKVEGVFCPTCGAKLISKGKFCPECGSILKPELFEGKDIK